MNIPLAEFVEMDKPPGGGCSPGVTMTLTPECLRRTTGGCTDISLCVYAIRLMFSTH